MPGIGTDCEGPAAVWIPAFAGMTGEDAAGRRLALIFTRRGDRLRPISCRAMRPKERALYEEARRQED
jgi:hypothetical protein